MKLKWGAQAIQIYGNSLNIVEELLFLGKSLPKSELFEHRGIYREAHTVFTFLLEKMQQEVSQKAESYVWKYGKVRRSIINVVGELGVLGVQDDIGFRELTKECGKGWINFVLNQMIDCSVCTIFTKIVRQRYNTSLSKYENEFLAVSGKEADSEVAQKILKKVEDVEKKYPGDQSAATFKQYLYLLQIDSYFQNVDLTSIVDLRSTNDYIISLIVQKSTQGVPLACTTLENIFPVSVYSFFEGIPNSEHMNASHLARVLLFPKGISEEEVYNLASQVRIQTFDVEKGSVWFTTIKNGIDFLITFPDGGIATLHHPSFIIKKLLTEPVYERVRHDVLKTLALYTLSEEVIMLDLGEFFVPRAKIISSQRKLNTDVKEKIHRTMKDLLNVKYFPSSKHSSCKMVSHTPTKTSEFEHETRSYTFSIPYYKRPLPTGHKPTTRALAIAKKHNIELGYVFYFDDGRRIKSEEVASLAQEAGCTIEEMEIYFELEGGVKHLCTFVEIEKSIEDHHKLQTVKAATTIEQL